MSVKASDAESSRAITGYDELRAVIAEERRVWSQPQHPATLATSFNRITALVDQLEELDRSQDRS